MKSKEIEKVTLGGKLTIEEFVAVARYKAKVEFSEEYKNRVVRSRKIIEKCVEEQKVVYGTTTGFGALVTQNISKDQAEILQRNIIITHSTSVGEPFSEEVVRAIMLMVLQSLGMGVSGVRLELLEQYREFLNKNLTPYVPKEGSVGYLCAEAHTASVLLGEGKAYYEGKLYDSRTALEKAGMKPFTLSYKEGLALTNGVTSPAAMAALAVYDMRKAIDSADIIAALSFEGLHGLLKAYDDQVLACRPFKEIRETAHKIKDILKDSQVVKAAEGSHVQDSLSLRCIPQLHGAVKKTVDDAWRAVEIEINGCGDNPIVVGTEDEFDVFSNGNPDSAYMGLEMDSVCIAAGAAAKMSERRNARFLDDKLSGYPSFLVKNPGLNSGLMIPQYTQAGLMNDMKILAHPASVDSITTSANQEDYVAMGYNACKKALKCVEKLEYILAIELFSAYQAQQFIDEKLERGQGSRKVLAYLKERIPVMEEDMYIYPNLEALKTEIHEGGIIDCLTEKDQ